MDYTSIHDDGDMPSGSSPWASSPQQSKNFRRESIERPQSPTPAPLGPPAGEESDYMGRSTNGHDGGPDQLPPAPSTATATDLDTSGDQVTIPYRTQQNLPPAQDQGSQYPYEQRSEGHQRHQPAKKQLKRQQYTLTAKVNGLERSGRKDPMLRFDVHTNLPGYRTTQFRDVRRSHAEFKNLADHLVSANPEALVPALPPASTAAGVGTDEDETKVKANLQRWLNYVCSSDILMRDEELVRFVEGDPGYSPVMRRSQPATGVRRKVLKQFAPPPDDTPELQDARPVVKRFYLGTMEAEQRLEKLVKSRRSLGLAEVELGQQLTAMSEHEIHLGLKNAYRKLGRTVQTTGDLHAAQGTAEASTLGDQFAYHSADAFIVKETLTNRHILLRELLQAQQTTRSRLNATDRLKASTNVRREKVDEAIAALDEARSHESYLHQKTQRVTANLVQDRRRWFARTSADLRASVREYVLREIEAERRCLATLEAVRPDIRAIDPSGGLSRLGREATLAARRAQLSSSQGPKGDAWSGVPRRQGDGLNRSVSSSFVAPSTTATAAGGRDGEEDPVSATSGVTFGSGQKQPGAGGRRRAVSKTGSTVSVGAHDEGDDDDDRVDARNAASRLAASTF